MEPDYDLSIEQQPGSSLPDLGKEHFVFSRPKQGKWDDQLSPLSDGELAQRKIDAKRDKDTKTLQKSRWKKKGEEREINKNEVVILQELR